jgi:1A family penicillin-binding protein
MMWRIGLWTGVIGIVALTAILAWLYRFATPDAATLPGLPLAQTSFLYDRSGEHVLYKMYGEENRKTLSREDISDVSRKATVAAEDNAFYDHHGIDIRAVARALRVNLQSGRIEQGGSTVTQQLARNAFYSRDRTWKRKVLETVTAIKIENVFTKDEILDMYLNRVPYGANTYGVGAAAEVYFGKTAKDLTIDEAALLASLTKAPSVYSPYVAKETAVLAGRDRVIRRMRQMELISEDDMKQSLARDTVGAVVPLSHAIDAPHFVFYVLERLEEEYGKEALQTGGWKIYTTLDWRMQQAAEKAVADGVARNASRHATNAALTAIDPKSGEVLAMVGSRDFFDKSIDGEVNVATRPRQPGSSFKPIVYAAAFAKGFQPETLLTDKPIDFGPDGSGGNYIPQNYNYQFRGMVSMRDALAQSLNIPAVETLYLAGIAHTIDTAHRLGITTLQDAKRYGLALSLGGGEAKLVDMTSAFGVFAADGMRTPTHGVLRIVVDSGEEVARKDESRRFAALDTETARKINAVLSDNAARSAVFGSHSPLVLADRPAAAKTGTTQNFHDAWTVGYIPSLAAGVWAGNNDNKPMKAGSDGIYAAAPIWNDFMKAVVGTMPVETFVPYTKVESDKFLITGKRDESAIKYYDTKSGKELSPEKAAKKDPDRVRTSMKDLHTVLYYVNKDDPLGATPPDYGDPMLPRWEGAWDASKIPQIPGFILSPDDGRTFVARPNE